MVESALKTAKFCFKFKWNLYSYSQTLTLLFIWESIVIYKPHFLFFYDHPKDIWFNLLLRLLHSATNFMKFKLWLSDSDFTLYNIYNLSFYRTPSPLLTSAPFSMSNLTISVWPFPAASQSGVFFKIYKRKTMRKYSNI